MIIHHLVCTGTRDEDVMQALQRKDDVQSWVMESLKARIKKIKKKEAKAYEHVNKDQENWENYRKI